MVGGAAGGAGAAAAGSRGPKSPRCQGRSDHKYAGNTAATSKAGKKKRIREYMYM